MDYDTITKKFDRIVQGILESDKNGRAERLKRPLTIALSGLEKELGRLDESWRVKDVAGAIERIIEETEDSDWSRVVDNFWLNSFYWIESPDDRDKGGKVSSVSVTGADMDFSSIPDELVRMAKGLVSSVSDSEEVFAHEMNRYGKHSKELQNGLRVDVWTLNGGTKIKGSFVKNGFHVDRILVPSEIRGKGESKKALRIIGKAADSANTILTTFGTPDDDSFHDKWVRTMRVYGGFEVDVDTVKILTDMTDEEVREGDKRFPRDEMIRFPRR